jgi:hypothetical protein
MSRPLPSGPFCHRGYQRSPRARQPTADITPLVTAVIEVTAQGTALRHRRPDGWLSLLSKLPPSPLNEGRSEAEARTRGQPAPSPLWHQ